MACPIRRAPVSQIVLEEIALEGLEGITLSSLWTYLSFDLDVPLPLTSDVLNRVWEFIKRNTHQLEFYELPTDRPTVQLENRLSYVDPDFGVPLVPDPAKFPRYKYVLIEDGNIFGSCECYKERKRIKDTEVSDLSAEATFERWGNRFIIVASQELRYFVLTPRNKPIPQDLTVTQYCFWEAIGRSRYNGETTSGPYSLLQLCKDSSVVFYIKNKLIQLGLVVQQPYNEFRDERLMVTSLLNLAQYVPEIPHGIISLVEKIYELVKKAPNESLPVKNLREEIPPLSRKSTLRRLIVTPFFQRIFEMKKTKTSKKSKKGNEISVLGINLKNPEAPINKLIEEVMDAEKTEERTDLVNALVDNKHSFVDMPLKEEFYRAVVRHGTRGGSLTELGSYLSESHGVVRQIAKALQRDGLIVPHVVDEGRQRIQKFVALEILNSAKAAEDKQISKSEELAKFSELPPIAPPEDNFPMDFAEIETTVEEYKCTEKRYRMTHTGRQLHRRNFIIQQLNEHAILSTIILRTRLQESERKQGYKDEICFKSIRRIIMELKNTDNLKAYEITINFQGYNRLYRYVAHPEINSDHILFQSELKGLKSMLLAAKQREESKKLNRRLILSRQLASQVQQKATALTKKAAIVMKPSPPELPLKPPKFLISRYMHEFLFYIVVELNEHQQMLEIDENLLQAWTENEPSLQVNDFLQSLHAGNEVQHAYTQQLSWRTFITPLPNYSDKPAGWVFFLDAIDRMPLSIFNKIFRFQQTENDTLNEYLTHPVRQHYLMRQLPMELQNQINRPYLQRICTLVLKLLHHMGLIQINDSLNLKKDAMMLWVYLNRRTQILDTTPSEASYAKINTARKYEELSFYFSIFDDITSYWTQLHRICVYTKLGIRSAKVDQKSESLKDFSFLPSVSFDEAPQYDTGEVPGDRAGAAGFAAYLFAHTLRNWSWVLRTNTKPQQATSISRVALRNTTTKHLRLMGMRKSRLHMLQAKRLPQPTAAALTVKHYKKKSPSLRDAIDRDALKNMRTLRASWQKREDDLLKLARAVYNYISPSAAVLGLMVVGKVCRDVIRHHLGICNKTTQSCHRRMHYIIKQGRHKPEVPSWVHILQTNAVIQKVYGDNFLQRLKDAYPNREDYCDALVIHFIKIFHFLHQFVNNMKDSKKEVFPVMRPLFMIPNTLDEFNRLFIKRSQNSDERIIQYKNPCNEHEALTMLAVGVLHSSLCSALDKTTYTAQAFEIFKKFSEEVLQNAYCVARNGGLIVANKRKAIINMIPGQLTSPAYSFSVHYQRRLMFLRIPYNIYDCFYEFFEKVLGILLKPKAEFMEEPSTSKGKSIKNVVELKSPNAGQLFLITEGLSRNFLTCKIKLPINILTVDAEQRQTLSSMDRILDHYHCIFDNAPETEYAKNIENESSDKLARVKFHPANLCYKITYNPYDFISKLPARHLHFFCALDHLNHEVEINFSRLMHKDDEHDTLSIECPFNCVLKQANYINAIERIVQEKSTILRELKEMPPQKLLNMAMSGCSVTVESSNLLTLVRMLESFWREKEMPYERKDLGRVSANLKINKIIDWHRMCCEILEFNIAVDEKNDEYEPTLNKEERLARAQDVFVVNLPTLQLEINEDFRMTSSETALHNGLCVPKRLLEAEIDRDAILRKIVDESHWKYTDNTFTALKPKLTKLGFTVMEQQHVEDLLRYIESHKLGVPVTELLREFPYVQFLSRALRILSEHYLVKRAGIATMIYVHKSNIRPWVVHTFHIKRLERENLGPDGTVNLKRSATSGEEDNDEIEEASSSKKPKLTNNTTDSGSDQSMMSKRMPKPVKRFQSESAQVKTNEKECKRDVIVMKPHAWIRLNGTINRRVLDRWMGSILTECVSRSGCLVAEVYSKFPYLSPVEVMFLLEILCDLKCIHLTEMKTVKASLFSSHEKLQETIVKDIYDPQYTYVTAHAGAIMRMSIFIGNKKYSTQFF